MGIHLNSIASGTNFDDLLRLGNIGDISIPKYLYGIAGLKITLSRELSFEYGFPIHEELKLLTSIGYKSMCYSR